MNRFRQLPVGNTFPGRGLRAMEAVTARAFARHWDSLGWPDVAELLREDAAEIDREILRREFERMGVTVEALRSLSSGSQPGGWVRVGGTAHAERNRQRSAATGKISAYAPDPSMSLPPDLGRSRERRAVAEGGGSPSPGLFERVPPRG